MNPLPPSPNRTLIISFTHSYGEDGDPPPSQKKKKSNPKPRPEKKKKRKRKRTKTSRKHILHFRPLANRQMRINAILSITIITIPRPKLFPILFLPPPLRLLTILNGDTIPLFIALGP